MRVERLLKMGIGEIAYRGRQEAWKWLERARVNGNGNGDNRREAIFKMVTPDLNCVRGRFVESDLNGAAHALRDRFFAGGRSRFFSGAVSEEIPMLIAGQMPDSCKATIAAADAICGRRFNLLGYRGLTFGDPVDWHLDPVSGLRAPLAHWSRINPLDASLIGDSKVIWELNRHQWLVSLGQAYQITGDRRYADAFSGYVQDWIRANPVGVGINWASSLEVALRLISWSWALFLFQGSVELSPELYLTMLEAVSAHAGHIEKYLSYYFAPNTHLTGEALGLFYAGLLFPEVRPAKRWRELGARILIEQSERQIYSDGVYFEQSTYYQRYTVEIYLHFMMLAARNGTEIPAEIGERVQKMLDALLALRRPDGSMPQVGDADGGWLLPLVPRDPDDFRGVFSTAAVWFRRPDYAWAAGGLAPETLWLVGPSALKCFEALRPAPPATPPSRLFPDGGYVVLRSGWEKDAHQLIFDVGPLGCPITGGHGHADLLSIQCSVFGEPYLVDPGTYGYTSEPEWRDFFRSTAAHSTVLVDGASQALAAGPFSWQMRPRPRLRQWLSTGAYDLADAEHDAYQRLSDPVTHRRRVIFVKPRYWLLLDDLEGAAEHRIELHFQFAPMEVTLGRRLWAVAHGTRGRGLLIRAFSTVPLKVDLLRGELQPIRGWYSPDYGQRQPAPVLIYSAVSRLPLRILTLILPTESLPSPEPDVLPLLGDSGGLVGLIFRDRGEQIVFREQGVTVGKVPSNS